MTTTKNLLASTIESVVESLMQDRRTFCADDVLQIMLHNYKPVMKKYPLRSMRKFAALVRFTVTKLTATYADYVATRLHPNPTLAPNGINVYHTVDEDISGYEFPAERTGAMFPVVPDKDIEKGDRMMDFRGRIIGVVKEVHRLPNGYLIGKVEREDDAEADPEVEKLQAALHEKDTEIQRLEKLLKETQESLDKATKPPMIGGVWINTKGTVARELACDGDGRLRIPARHCKGPHWRYSVILLDNGELLARPGDKAMVTDRDKRVIQRIINAFETSKAEGDYGMVTLLPNDPGGLTYGRSQTTLNSGNLELLLDSYLDKRLAVPEDAEFYVPAVLLDTLMHDIHIKNQQLNQPNVLLHALLRRLGQDPIMKMCQDEFFDEAYWKPAYNKAVSIGLRYPLSYAVVYDGYVHGFFEGIRKKFPERPPANGGEEKAWTIAYVNARRNWLRSKSHLATTVYRMDTFLSLIMTGNWELRTPFSAHGVQINDN